MSATLRNVAIIAHVDHGKTTLIDVLLGASGTFRAGQKVAERAMDSNALEQERGITILAKVTSLLWKDTRINIVDTPGHADFGGEVERILNMVDGAILLVDAAEGPMPQTKFVLMKALAIGLKPIVVINKVDRSDAQPDVVLNDVFDLFAALDASDEQLDFPVLYGSAKQGWMALTPDGPKESIAPLLDKVLEHVAPPVVEDGPFRMLATTLEADPFLGRLLTGPHPLRLGQGRAMGEGAVARPARRWRISASRRCSPSAGSSAARSTRARRATSSRIAGLSEASVADTLADPSVEQPIPAQPIDPPTLAMTFRINDGPLAGQEGDKVQSRVIRERLLREAEGNVALKITEGEDKDAFEVAGRGELQLGILIETMRREGFELTIGKPRVVLARGERRKARADRGSRSSTSTTSIPASSSRRCRAAKGELVEMRPSGAGRTRLRFHIPTRGLIGYQPQLLSDTRGTAVMNRIFHAWEPYRGDIPGRRNGVLLSNARGRRGRLRALQPAGPRADDDRPRHARLSRHDRRRAHARQRPRDQCAEGQAAHQHPRRRQGRERRC